MGTYNFGYADLSVAPSKFNVVARTVFTVCGRGFIVSAMVTWYMRVGEGD
jgi:hypothetical protein